MSTWQWPVANDPPQAGDYLARHPTRYDNVWTSVAENWARWIVNSWYGEVWCNSYYDHPASEFYPAGGGRDADSIDVWYWDGRGVAIGSARGRQVLNALWPYRGDIEWLIFERTMYGDWNGWQGEYFGSDEFSWHDDHIHLTLKKGAGGSLPPDTKPTDLSVYPGNCSTPEQLAWWTKYIAEKDYGVPGELPVMTSYVEMTSAWDSPGCLEDIPSGYWTSSDWDSLGLYQQRASWGSYAERTDPVWATRRFLAEAAALKDWEWNENTTDPDALGRWAQAVQGSAYPDKYRDKGYPKAVELLKNYPTQEPEEPEVADWPHEKVRVSSDDWPYIDRNGERRWLQAPQGMVFETNSDGWLRRIGGTPPDEVWKTAVEREPDTVEYREKDGMFELRDGTKLTKAEFEKEYRSEEVK